ncbi:hypothetical protein O181_117680 [Austropuccinia psidii MF-1]|uniref:Uncharacterized protein n=1 Tax=Austropuccinia psidii MF-1 TaxID=1389203 RepID=A0A9Q3KAT6_9BASI|nr:hypothetical protein [Austropuccinia psidii MF-1]
MSSNYYNSSSSGEFAESNEPVLLQLVNQQYERIRQLEQKIDSHDQNLEALLNKFNLQEDTRNTLAKSKGKETQIPTNVLANNQNTTLKTPHKQKQILYQQISTSSQKQSPNQLLQSEIPEAFQPTKKEFCDHIKLLWGLIYQNSLPMSPDYTMLKEFNTCFSFFSDIVTQSENPNMLPLVPLEEIITLRNTPPGKKKIGNTIIHMTDFLIKYVVASLARLGICCWAPDLNEASNTLYNEACRVSALQTFHQIAISGAYEYMNINLVYLDNIQLLTNIYNHFVHWYMAQQSKKEAKEAGKHAKDQERRAVLRSRLRLKNLRYRFAFANGFPNRYLIILADPEAHRKDEFDPIRNKYMIKNLECCSEKATILMHRVDEEIAKAESTSRKKSQRRERHTAEDGRASMSKVAPKGLPIDFYNPDWFKNCTSGQKRSIAEIHMIAFLPDVSKSLLVKPHPDERLSDKQFTALHWEEVIEAYDISHEIQNDNELDTEDSDGLEVIASEEIDDEEEINNENNHQEKQYDHLLDFDIEMQDAESDNTLQQLQNSFFSLPNEWSS